MIMQEQVLAELRKAITSGELPPGSQLVQEDLAHRLQVSRVPVREALRSLTTEGLVEYFPNRGFFVAELSATDLAEVYRLRDIIESEVLVQAAGQISADDIRGIEDLLVAVERASSPEQVAEANRRFHFAIFELANLPRAVRLLEQLWDATNAYRAMYFALPESGERIAHEHRELWKCLAEGDGTGAVAAQSAHRQHAQEAVSRILLSENPGIVYNQPTEPR